MLRLRSQPPQAAGVASPSLGSPLHTHLRAWHLAGVAPDGCSFFSTLFTSKGLLQGGTHSPRQIMLWDRGRDPGPSPQSGSVFTGDHWLLGPQPQTTLSLVLSEVIRHFSPSVLKPICALGTGVVRRDATE